MLVSAVLAALLGLAPVACSDADTPAGSGGPGDEPGTDADVGPGAVPGEGEPQPATGTEPAEESS